MVPRLGLQLYSLREAMEKDFEGILREVARIGFAGVETAGFPGTTPKRAGELFRELGLEVAAAHTALPLGDDKGQVLDTLAEIGSPCAITSTSGEWLTSVDSVRRACDRLNDAAAICAENGFSFAIHNHYWEYDPVPGDGRPAMAIMMEMLDPSVLSEVDTYWVKTAGLDPVQVVREMGARAPLLHIKDGPATKEAPMTAVGEGVMDFAPIFEAGQGNTQWALVELDHCATDMLEAVRKSYQYLAGKGFAKGTGAVFC